MMIHNQRNRNVVLCLWIMTRDRGKRDTHAWLMAQLSICDLPPREVHAYFKRPRAPLLLTSHNITRLESIRERKAKKASRGGGNVTLWFNPCLSAKGFLCQVGWDVRLGVCEEGFGAGTGAQALCEDSRDCSQCPHCSPCRITLEN